MDEIQRMETTYNFEGLINYMMGKETVTVPSCMFCSEFVSFLLKQAQIELFDEKCCRITPKKFAETGISEGVYEIYKGWAKDYRKQLLM